MRPFLASELDALFRQPTLEFRALHRATSWLLDIVHIFVYRRKALLKSQTAFQSIRVPRRGLPAGRCQMRADSLRHGDGLQGIYS
jgi:hypothetical protein